jgi:hypothetical protein
VRHGDWWVAVVSARRPRAVPAMAAQLGGVPATWYVAAGEAAAYRAAGAQAVTEGGPLAASRNAALDDAFAAGLGCVQVSDDLRRLTWTGDGQARLALTFAGAIGKLARGLDVAGAKLAGASPTDNLYFYRTPLSTRLFIVGDLVAVLPCPERYDPMLLVKEDYDYTLQHLAAYGRVARVNGVMAAFRHRSNAGGAVAYRTPALEEETIGYLRGKWGQDVVRPNPRRPGEVLLRWKEPAA